MVCRKCGRQIVETEKERPILGHSYERDENGQRIQDSEETFGLFHANCWERVKESLGPEPAGTA